MSCVHARVHTYYHTLSIQLFLRHGRLRALASSSSTAKIRGSLSALINLNPSTSVLVELHLCVVVVVRMVLNRLDGSRLDRHFSVRCHRGIAPHTDFKPSRQNFFLTSLVVVATNNTAALFPSTTLLDRRPPLKFRSADDGFLCWLHHSSYVCFTNPFSLTSASPPFSSVSCAFL